MTELPPPPANFCFGSTHTPQTKTRMVFSLKAWSLDLQESYPPPRSSAEFHRSRLQRSREEEEKNQRKRNQSNVGALVTIARSGATPVKATGEDSSTPALRLHTHRRSSPPTASTRLLSLSSLSPPGPHSNCVWLSPCLSPLGP